MADTPRISALTSLAVASHPCPAAELRPLAPSAKFIFRGLGRAVTTAGHAFGVVLPETACRAATVGDRAALWLGPDEWLLIAPEGDDIAGSFLALSGQSHALVDIGHRNVGLEIAGAEAATVLSAGCPLDLDPDAFPVGMCTRTVLGKAEIILWRTAPDIFHVEVWRSFSAYVWQFLDESRGEFR